MCESKSDNFEYTWIYIRRSPGIKTKYTQMKLYVHLIWSQQFMSIAISSVAQKLYTNTKIEFTILEQWLIYFHLYETRQPIYIS